MRITINLSDDIFEKLDNFSIENDVSISFIISMLLSKNLDSLDKSFFSDCSNHPRLSKKKISNKSTQDFNQLSKLIRSSFGGNS